MELAGFECPSCGAGEMVHGPDGHLVCVYCGTSFGEVTRICPRCGHYNAAGARHCAHCGTQILRDCPACGADNWTAAGHCVQCGRNLDLIEQLAHRWQQTTQQRLYARQAGMVALKAQEERASQQRMATFMEVERGRQEALARARAAQRERDRQLYLWLAVAAVAFLLLVVLSLVLTSGGS
jgi:ribosomal protein L40E